MNKSIYLLILLGCESPVKTIDVESCIAECIKELEADDIEEHCADSMRDRPCCQWGEDILPCDMVERILTSPK